jgi:hypothetical protein
MDPQNVVLKQTVNLPTTAFSMKANLPQAEPKMLARREEEKLYHKISQWSPLFRSILQHVFPEYRSTRVFLWKSAIAKKSDIPEAPLSFAAGDCRCRNSPTVRATMFLPKAGRLA